MLNMLTLTPPGFHHLNHNGTEPVGQAEKKKRFTLVFLSSIMYFKFLILCDWKVHVYFKLTPVIQRICYPLDKSLECSGGGAGRAVTRVDFLELQSMIQAA